ncbi:hypothetical protein [Flavobacterium sp.]|uniref:hypothetical protein n=1 Tax=Flavobacterium sp. TaxID=239 RepID=UPI00262EA141|nr:hypothetical protein [Flavobacterium sp.]
MKFHPIDLLKIRVLDYLTNEDQFSLIEKIAKKKTHREVLSVILKNFDIDIFKNSPLMLEDIYLYNYIKYEITSSKFPRTSLIMKYERRLLKKVKI